MDLTGSRSPLPSAATASPEDRPGFVQRLLGPEVVTMGSGTLDFAVPVLGIAAWSGTGKTTLLVRVLPLLRARGLRVGLVKYTHHNVEVDTPGKDSYELRAAGASPVLLASPLRQAMMTESPAGAEPALADLIRRFRPEEVDLVLVEGFKHEAFPKLEIYRAAVGRPPMYPDDPDVLAVVTDVPLHPPARVPVLDLNRPAEVVDFIADYVSRGRARRAAS